MTEHPKQNYSAVFMRSLTNSWSSDKTIWSHEDFKMENESSTPSNIELLDDSYSVFYRQNLKPIPQLISIFI